MEDVQGDKLLPGFHQLEGSPLSLSLQEQDQSLELQCFPQKLLDPVVQPTQPLRDQHEEVSLHQATEQDHFESDNKAQVLQAHSVRKHAHVPLDRSYEQGEEHFQAHPGRLHRSSSPHQASVPDLEILGYARNFDKLGTCLSRDPKVFPVSSPQCGKISQSYKYPESVEDKFWYKKRFITTKEGEKMVSSKGKSLAVTASPATAGKSAGLESLKAFLIQLPSTQPENALSEFCFATQTVNENYSPHLGGVAGDIQQLADRSFIDLS